MTKEEIQEQYKALILPESKNPYHFGQVAANLTIKAYNPMCGDKLVLHLKENNGTITDVHFHGYGCAISKASTSILLREVEGKSMSETIAFCESFLHHVENGKAPSSFREELKILVALKDFEGRMDCIQLSWKALLEHVKKST